jgi:pyruvate/2-oxoglutarate dehydrogenase complex dihydrolipoamide dehydrogenase (E3) component
MKKYDLVLLGASSAGFAAAIKAQELGKVAIIENRTVGGTCVNVNMVVFPRNTCCILVTYTIT